MFGNKRPREDQRYYLLPGMGRSNRRHRRQIHLAAVAFGALVAALFGGLIYLLNR